MRKIVLMAAMAAVCIGSIALESCTKEKTITKEFKNQTSKQARIAQLDVYKTQYGFLKFKDRETFDKILEQIKDYSIPELNAWTEQMQFNSLLSMNESNETLANESLGLEDPVLKSVLDNNNSIQIGDFVYRIDVGDAQVWTMQARNLETEIDNFKNKDFNSATMNVLNFDFEQGEMDLIEFVENKNVGLRNTKKLFSFGQDSKPPYVEKCSETICVKGNTKAVYQAVGIYFSLYTECKTYRRPTGNNLWLPTSTNIFLTNSFGDSYARWVSKKSSLSQTAYIFKNTSNNGYHHDWRPYSKSRGLHSYEIHGKFKYFGAFDIQQNIENTAYLVHGY
jgi:spore coat protein CotF